MAITAPPTIPVITDPSTFATRAQDWVVWQAEQLYPELVSQSSLLGLSLSATSSTSNTVGTGSKTFTVETGKGFVEGVSLSVANVSDPTDRMFCVVTSYNSMTGELIVTSQAFEGSGTYTDWQIAPAFNGVIGTGQISDNAVTTAKILDGAVTADKLSSRAKANRLYDLDASVASNALTLTVNAGTWDFRSTTLTDGTPVTRTLSSPVNVVVPDTATLGTVNATEAMLAVILIDNAGTLEAAVINIAGGVNLDERGLITTTTIGTGSDSALVAYSTTGRTNVAYRVIGYITITEATAGTWATAPSTVVSAGSLSENAINFNASGNAPMFACRAWVNFNGTGTVAIRASGNVSSITDNATGNYTVNFIIAMPDANYSVSALPSKIGAGGQTSNVISTLTTSVQVNVTDAINNIAEDSAIMSVAIFR